jgi:hypothetical protein
LGTPFNLSHKAISPPVDSLDVSRASGIVLKGTTQLADRGRQSRIAHHRIGPHRRKQVVFGHQLLWTRHQLQQHLKGFTGKPHHLVPVPKALVIGI